jgi:hypothetical protein
MNVLEKRVVYATSLFVYFLSKGKPINPSVIEKFWKNLSEVRSLKYKDSNNNKFVLNLLPDVEFEEIDYSAFISYISEAQEYVKKDKLSVVLNVLEEGNCTLSIDVSNNIILSLKKEDMCILEISLNFSEKTNYSMVVGKKDLYVDGGFKKNCDYLSKLFFHSVKISEIPLYREYKRIQDVDGYYKSVKFLYEYFVEEINKRMDDPEYVEELFNKVLLLSHGVTLDNEHTDIKTKDNNITISKNNILAAKYVAEVSDTETPILKIKMQSVETDLFKIRSKKEKYKEEFRYKTYFELGTGFKLLINEE